MLRDVYEREKEIFIRVNYNCYIRPFIEHPEVAVASVVLSLILSCMIYRDCQMSDLRSIAQSEVESMADSNEPNNLSR